MAITEPYQSSASITASEYFCAVASTTQGSGIATDGIYQAIFELSALAAGDEFRIRVWDAISSGGTSRILMEWTVGGAQSSPNWATPALMLLHKWDFSLQKLSGTDRTIAWSIRAVT